MGKQNKVFPDHGEEQMVIVPNQQVALLTAGKCASSPLKNIGLLADPKNFRKDVTPQEVEEQYDHYCKIAIWRDPVDRLASCYRDKILRTFYKGFRWMPGIKKNMSFDEFAKAVCTIPDNKADGHFRSQSCFYLRKDGTPLFDLLLSFSEFPDCWSIAQKVIFDLPDIVRTKKGTRGKYQEGALGYNTKQLLFKRYEADCQLKDYVRWL